MAQTDLLVLVESSRTILSLCRHSVAARHSLTSGDNSDGVEHPIYPATNLVDLYQYLDVTEFPPMWNGQGSLELERRWILCREWIHEAIKVTSD
jgi:hypothetical protein